MAAPIDPPAFTPAALAPRRDGWTAERQRRFITALTRTGVVTRAAAAAGIAVRSAYRLRARPEGAAFARAWNEAVRAAATRRAAAAVVPSPELSDRALLRRLAHLHATNRD